MMYPGPAKVASVPELARRLCEAAAALPEMTVEQHRLIRQQVPCSYHVTTAQRLIGLVSDRTTLHVLRTYAAEVAS